MIHAVTLDSGLVDGRQAKLLQSGHRCYLLIVYLSPIVVWNFLQFQKNSVLSTPSDNERLGMPDAWGSVELLIGANHGEFVLKYSPKQHMTHDP